MNWLRNLYAKFTFGLGPKPSPGSPLDSEGNPLQTFDVLGPYGDLSPCKPMSWDEWNARMQKADDEAGPNGDFIAGTLK